mgnify:FL=1
MMLASYLFAQDGFKEYAKEQQDAIDRMIEEEINYFNKITEEFETYATEQDKLFQNF